MPCILIIEDEVQVRKLTRQMLEMEGLEVIEAGDGDSGLKLFTENEIDLVITDIIMPGKEGIETILELRRKDPAVKIIAMSGGGRMGPDGYLDLAKKFGASQAFSKPFDRLELVQAVKDLLACSPTKNPN